MSDKNVSDERRDTTFHSPFKQMKDAKKGQKHAKDKKNKVTGRDLSSSQDFKFIDDEPESARGQRTPAAQYKIAHRHNNTATKKSARVSDSDGHKNADTYQHHDHNHDDRQSSLEEVYLCSCCGVTKELEPAMKYMPVFRCLFFLFNFLVFSFGLADLGMGLWFRIDPKVYELHKYIETQNFTIAGWIMLFGGFLACLVSLSGFMAAMRNSISLMILYTASMVVLTIAFIGVVVLLTVYGLGRKLELFLIKEIYEQIRRRTMNTELDLFMNTDAAQFLDFIQVKMRCCGATDFRDYQKLGMVIPTTCYTIAGNLINAPGCGHAIRQLMDIRAGLGVAFVTGSCVAQLFTILSASLMCCSIYNWRASPKPKDQSRSVSPMQFMDDLDDEIHNHREVEPPRHLAAQHNYYNRKSPSKISSIVV